jgi:hypothetical protein
MAVVIRHMVNSTKQCRGCQQAKAKSEFVSRFGFENPRGQLCRRCWIEQQKREVVELMDGREFCLYCGTSIPRARDYDENGKITKTHIHMDHMDPIALGGYDPHTYDLDLGGFPENTLRNTVYCCAKCNNKKRDMLFRDWLKLIPEENQKLARKVYIERNGIVPEDFIAHKDLLIRIDLNGSGTQ